MLACASGHADCVEALIKAGCDKKARNKEGSTGLMLAAKNGKLVTLQTLLDAGWPDLEVRDDDGFTAFLVACVLFALK